MYFVCAFLKYLKNLSMYVYTFITYCYIFGGGEGGLKTWGEKQVIPLVKGLK